MSDDNVFDPEDIADLESTFDSVIRDTHEGYVMELMFSRQDARDMLEAWQRAKKQDMSGIAECLANYALIMEEVRVALETDDRS